MFDKSYYDVYKGYTSQRCWRNLQIRKEFESIHSKCLDLFTEWRTRWSEGKINSEDSGQYRWIWLMLFYCSFTKKTTIKSTQQKTRCQSVTSECDTNWDGCWESNWWSVICVTRPAQQHQLHPSVSEDVHMSTKHWQTPGICNCFPTNTKTSSTINDDLFQSMWILLYI